MDKTINRASGFNPKTGFTLIELLIVVSLIAIIVTLLVPNFSNFIDQRALQRAGEDVYSAMTLARSEAIKQEKVVSIGFVKSGDNWCYGFDDDVSTTCNCVTTPANCTLYSVQKVVSNGLTQGTPFKNVTLVANKTMTFSAGQGVVSSADSVALQISAEERLHVLVDTSGRIRIQSDLKGYPDIPGT